MYGLHLRTYYTPGNDAWHAVNHSLSDTTLSINRLTMGVLTLSTGVCMRSGRLAWVWLKRFRNESTRSTLPASPSAASSCNGTHTAKLMFRNSSKQCHEN